MVEDKGPDGFARAPGLSDRILFWASFLTLIAAGIGFSVRGAVLKDWGNQFGFTQAELGTISGGGLAGFGLAIIFFSFCADLFGYGKLMLVAFLLHAASAVLTFAATPVFNAYGKEGAFYCLNAGMWLFALGNGTCEAVINPLTATLFPRNKTHWLNILHAGWPVGLILGAVIVLGFGQVGGPIRWEFKLGIFLVPVLAYGVLMFNRQFPRSEASSAGISLPSMMRQVGLIGFSIATAFVGLAFSDLLPTVLGVPGWVGWVVAVSVWLAFAITTNFAPGNLVIGFLYVLHAMVGYVELGTDSWIVNITERVLNNADKALLAFIWTNALMAFLRFFAGPIVHRINPIGLLLVSALLGTAGLYMLGLPFTDSVWLWLAAATVYGIGKTFYWPTLLGVISERFPRGGALALGVSGGIGMISAGMIGTPGIGYQQDYFAVQKLEETSVATYERYVSRKEDGQPKTKDYPVLTAVAPTVAPPVAGLDNGKLKVFDDFQADLRKVLAAKQAKTPANKLPRVLSDTADSTRDVELDEDGKVIKVPVTFTTRASYDALVEAAKKAGIEAPPLLTTTLQSDLNTLRIETAAGKPVEAKLAGNLNGLNLWWLAEGLPNFSADQPMLGKARLFGAKSALLYTAGIPAVLAVGFLILLLYFAATGGYKQVYIHDPHGGMSVQATPR